MSTTTAGRCVSPSSRGDRHDAGTRDRTTAGSPSEGETWHNWIIRLVEDGVAVGFVQATVTDVEADIACLIGVDLQGRGFATEAATAMIEWLVAGGTRRMVAHIHPDHAASGKVAAALGLEPTGEVDFDGETIWKR
jgi:RimJ/RimL family protein N-acetyltransferase